MMPLSDVNTFDDDSSVSTNDAYDVSSIAITLLKYAGTENGIYEMISLGLGYELIDIVLTLNGMCIQYELSKKNILTGFYPFMSGAMSPQCGLSDVYKIAKANVNILKRNEDSTGKRGNTFESDAYNTIIPSL